MRKILHLTTNLRLDAGTPDTPEWPPEVAVYRDPDWDEYRVKLGSNGKFTPSSDLGYFTDDRQDATGTAYAMLWEADGRYAWQALTNARFARLQAEKQPYLKDCIGALALESAWQAEVLRLSQACPDNLKHALESGFKSALKPAQNHPSQAEFARQA